MNFILFKITCSSGFKLSDVTLFDELDIKYFDKGELIYIPGDKMLMFLGVQEFFGFPVLFPQGFLVNFHLGSGCF